MFIKRITIFLCICVLFFFSFPILFAAPTDYPLAQVGDFNYVGAFGIKGGTYGESRTGFSAAKFGIDSQKKSIYLVSHTYGDAIGEFEIPELVNTNSFEELNHGANIQPFYAVINRTKTGTNDSINEVGYIYNNEGELLVQTYQYYDGNADNQDTSLVVRNKDMLNQSQIDGFYQMAGRAHTVMWISKIPSAWSSYFNGNHIAGQGGGMPIHGRSSMGPSMWTFDINDFSLAESGSIQANKLLDYGLSHVLSNNEQGWTDSWDGYNEGGDNDIWTQVSGGKYGFIIPGTRTYAVIGNTGMIESGGGYKIRQDNGTGRLCGGPCAYNSSDYYVYVWFWDLKDVLKIKSGELESYEAKPYYYGKFLTPFNLSSIGSAHYDYENDLLYISSGGIDSTQSRYEPTPIFLVYNISIPQGRSSLGVITGFKNISASSSLIELRWDGYSDATEYTIYRNGNPLQTISSTSYTDVNLSSGKEYTYYVEGYNGDTLLSQSFSLDVKTQEGSSLSNSSSSKIIFEDNFDSQPDWTNKMYSLDNPQHINRNDVLPWNWTTIYSGDRWYPGNGYLDNRNSLEILEKNVEKAKGKVGKSAVMWRESYGKRSRSWASDSQLLKYLGKEYDELYLDFYIRFGPDFYGINNTGGWASKVFRVGSWNGEGNIFNGALGSIGPVFFWDYKHDSYGVRNLNAFRGGPWGENYKFNNEYDFGGSLNFKTDTLGQGINGSDPLLPDRVNGGYVKDYPGLIDHEQVFGYSDEWTKITFYVKMNSAPGVEDGVFKQWINGVQIRHEDSIPWIMDNSEDIMVGWNYFAIGGNDYFQPYNNSVRFEDWYSLDDVVVYTPLDSSDPMWEESPGDGRLPLDYDVGSTLTLSPNLSLQRYPPTDFRVTHLNDTSVTFNWSLPENYEYSHIEIYRNGSEIHELYNSYPYSLDKTATSYTDYNLTTGKTYVYRVLGVGGTYSKPLYVTFGSQNGSVVGTPQINTTTPANQTNSSSDDSTSENDSADDPTSSGSSGSSSSGSSELGGSLSSGNSDSSNEESSESGSSYSDASSYVAPSCQSDFSYSSWSSCVDGEQFRIVNDQNSCVDSTQETRTCTLNADENELKELNAKEIQFSKINNRRYETTFSDTYNEMVYTNEKLEDESFVVVDSTTKQQYLGTLVNEESGKYYYTLERVDQNNLNTLKEEGLAERSLTESFTSSFEDFKNSRNFVSVIVILTLFGITTIIYLISRYIKKLHGKSSFE